MLSDDVKTLSRAPGIGKKTAQKLILELKDKLRLEDAFEKETGSSAGGSSLIRRERQRRKQGSRGSAVALGYSSTDALRAVRKVSDVPPEDVEAILKSSA